MQRYLLPGYGETDSKLITSTDAWTGRAASILVLEATVFTTLTGTYTLHTGSALADATFPGGAILRGFFTAITLASGAVWVGLLSTGETVAVSGVTEEPTVVRLGPSATARLGLK